MKEEKGIAEIVFETKLEKFADGLYQYHVKVSSDVLDQVKEWRSDKRVMCILDGKLEFYAGILTKNGIHYIMINKSRRNKLDINVGEKLECIVRKSQNQYGIEIPESFQFLLQEDLEFDQLFHALTGGKQRSLLHMIGKVKDEELQVNRLMLLCEHLKEEKGKLDFKILNDKFRSARNEKG